VRKYAAFLTARSQLALQGGAAIARLEDAEQALGARLPWEVCVCVCV
jgi:hypothetical protein